MKLFVLLIYKNAIEQFRDVKRNSILFIIPIAIFICIYGYFSMNDLEMEFIKPIQVGIVIDDENYYSRLLVNDFGDKENLSQFFKLLEEDRELIYEKYDNKEIDGIITIPVDYVESLISFDDNPLELVINNQDPIKTMILLNAFRGYEQYIKGVEVAIEAFYDTTVDYVEWETYKEYNNSLSFELINMILDRQEVYDYNPVSYIPSVTSIMYYFIALSFMFVQYFSLFSCMSMIEEQKEHAFKRMLTTQIHIGHYLIAKWISYVVFIFGMFFIWSIAFGFVSDERFLFGNPEVTLFIILVISLSVTVGMGLTMFFKSKQEYMLFTIVICFLMAILGGSIIPIHYMPKAIQFIGKWMPNFVIIRQALLLLYNKSEGSYLVMVISLIAANITLFVLIIGGYLLKFKGGFSTMMDKVSRRKAKEGYNG